MRNYRLHFIRHGMTASNEKGAYAGRRTDAELSAEGIRELIRLREEYDYPPVDAVFCSPMTRCIQTAGVLYPQGDLQVVENLAEMDFGDFDFGDFDPGNMPQGGGMGGFSGGSTEMGAYF